MPSDPAELREIRLVFDADPLAVRAALCVLFEGGNRIQLEEDARGTAEIVLAEVLNNVVEHAYAAGLGKIEVLIRVTTGALVCTIRDRGLPMPGSRLPEGLLRPAPVDDLPEGGFGWHLIRTLSQDLAYQRIEDRNELTFRLATQQSGLPTPAVTRTETMPQ